MTTATKSTQETSIEIAVDGVGRGGWVRMGVPLSRGAYRDAASLAIVDRDGTLLASQLTPLARWPDGSVKWLLCEWIHSGEISVTLRPAEPPRRRPGRPVSLSRIEGAVVVERGTAIWRFAPGGSLWGESGVDCEPSLSLDVQGFGRCEAVVEGIEALAEGPVRAAVRVRARVVCGEVDTGLMLDAESHFFADGSLRKATLTIRNTHRAAHPGGVWELGDAGSTLISDLSIHLKPSRVGLQPVLDVGDGSGVVSASRVDLFQASSGGEHWDSHNHVDRSGAVNLPFCGYRLVAGEREVRGRRACPVARLESDDMVLAVGPEKFWQNFPKSLRCGREGVEIGLFPRDSGVPHELQGGEQKTHAFWIAEDKASSESLERILIPPVLRLDPDYVAQTGAERFLSPSAEENPLYRRIVEQAVEGPSSLFTKREAIDEYGWRHFGDAYGDHEAAFHEGPTPLVSHWNNQYDLIFGLGVRFLASGDPRWFDLAGDMAWHVLDIDIYHTDQDKAAYNHGLFWHTVHYVDAGKANHRSYPRGTVGGGPCAEHSYARGLRLFYYLTGERAASDAVIELAEWVLAMEDGSTTPFRWLSSGPTGLSSASGNPNYHGPGRGPGNATETLLTAFEMTGDRRYLERVEELMRRVVCPDDDQESLKLLDPETRWYYTLYLQGLGRYLEIKNENGEHDDSYAYGRETLIAYASWMADNEYPYLAKPEILEFPTETWSAQDIRKSEVFLFAARHLEPGRLRESFLDRARFFFEQALHELQGDPRSSFTRPVALLLGSGFSYEGMLVTAGALKGARPDRRQHGRIRSGPPFVPQKVQAIRRAKVVAVVGATIGTILAATVTVLLWAT